jgi:Heterokaryon incompatibility protein (HET)
MTGGTSDETIPDSELYMHKPLKNETSLSLLLKKGRNKDPLECELIEFSIDTVAIYEALSYACGPKTPQKCILCQGKKLPITESCEAALLHLRYPFGGRLLWVDSFCIDQTPMNNIEKNQQLPLMGHIYSRATDVLIWLGPPTPEINTAFRYVDLYAAFLFIRGHSLFAGVGASVVKKIGELIIDKITSEYLPINH